MQSEKQMIRGTANLVGGGLILYMLVNYAVVFGVIFLRYFVQAFLYHAGPAPDVSPATEAEDDATGMIAGVILGCIPLYLYMRKRLTLRGVFSWRDEMTARHLFGALCVLMAGQVLFTFAADGLEILFNRFGFTIESSVESATADSTTLSMFLYTGVVAPVVEELVYRGFAMRSLARYGEWFAIVMSAFLFGVMHANLPQCIYAFYCGLVLGYVAMRTSIVWSMLLHAMNNLVFGDLFVLLTESLDDHTYYLISAGINLVFVAGAAIALLAGNGRIREYLGAHRTTKGAYRYTLSAVLILIFILFHLAVAFFYVERI